MPSTASSCCSLTQDMEFSAVRAWTSTGSETTTKYGSTPSNSGASSKTKRAPSGSLSDTRPASSE